MAVVADTVDLGLEMGVEVIGKEVVEVAAALGRRTSCRG